MIKRILITDDHDEYRSILEEALTYSDFEVKSTGSSKDLFNEIETFQPDLLLLDYRLPDESGTQVCERIRKNSATAKLPILLISAYIGPGDDFSCCNGVLSKPFDLETLLKEINAILSVQLGEQTVI